MLHLGSRMTVGPEKLVRRLLVLACFMSLVLVLGSRTKAKQETPPQRATPPPITFNRDIAPVLFRTCARCHRPGEAGPFSLLTYPAAKSHARQIAAGTKRRFMPPWLPGHGELKFAYELRLSDDEIARIHASAEQCAVQ